MGTEHSEEITENISIGKMARLTERMAKNFSLIGLLEFRKANLSLVSIFIAGAIILFALISLWLILMLEISLMLYAHHWTLPHILGIVAAFQALLAVGLFFLIRLLSKNLLFPKTREAFAVFK